MDDRRDPRTAVHVERYSTVRSSRVKAPSFRRGTTANPQAHDAREGFTTAAAALTDGGCAPSADGISRGPARPRPSTAA